jgi:uncharacterized protein YbaR (Trm112 family)
MLDQELLALLVCPETHQDLTLATSAEIAQLNEAISLKQIRTTEGKEVDEPLEGALIRVDRHIAYPIRDRIPVMMIPEGLQIAKLNLTAGTKA